MAPGDKVLLWATGNAKAVTRGIWGFGYVTGATYDRVLEDIDPTDYGYWLDEQAAVAAVNVVDVRITLFEQAVSHADLLAAGINDLEVQVQAQGQNPSWVSKDQLKSLDRLLPEWSDDTGAREILMVRGAGFGDPANNALVELAGMQAVQQVYEAEGWELTDVSADNVGWDFRCARGAERLYLEVKGVSGDRPRILLTRNEHRAAMETEGWALAVVVRALTAPEVGEYSADEVISRAKPFAFEADLSNTD